MSDEGFHEIQLGGKQLVFLFMAAAVVGVVLFLAGVMVGRGVRTEVAALAPGGAPLAADLSAAGAEPAAPVPEARRTVQPAGAPASARPASPPSPPPPPVADDIPRAAAPAELPGATKPPAPAAASPNKGAVSAPAREAAVKSAAPGATAAAGVAAKPAPTVAAKPAPRTPEPAAGEFAVQVAAPKDRGSAEAIARRLVGKGYSAYVLEPGAGSASPIYYRVRVGPFKTRRDADETRRRLEKEEQFKPFITR